MLFKIPLIWWNTLIATYAWMSRSIYPLFKVQIHEQNHAEADQSGQWVQQWLRDSVWAHSCAVTCPAWAVEVTLMHSKAPAAGSGCLGSPDRGHPSCLGLLEVSFFFLNAKGQN